MNISVREMLQNDIIYVVDYFVNASADFLLGMGVDKNKLPDRSDWIKKLETEFTKPVGQKEFYYIIWLLNDKPVGHSNINNIEPGNSATMHLHLWNNVSRNKSLGYEFLKLTLPYYFEKLHLSKVVCEPYSKNIAPNRLLKRFGFTLIREYETIPGWINFKQFVIRYELSRHEFYKLSNVV